MNTSEAAGERVTLEFRGAFPRAVFWFVIAGVLGFLVIPAAWGYASVSRRIVNQISFGDGTAAVFAGRPAKVWGWFVLLFAIPLLPTFVAGAATNENPVAMYLENSEFDVILARATPGQFAIYLGSIALALPLSIAIELVVYRWIVAGIRLSEGPDLRFTGQFLALLGWNLAFLVSVFTIIGWWWVAAAFCRWLASRIDGAGIRFEFVGSALGMLWRLLPVFLFLFVNATYVTLPLWAYRALEIIVVSLVLAWSMPWIIRNIVLIKGTTSSGLSSTGKSPPPARESPPPRAKTPTPKPKSSSPRKPTPPPADPPPDAPFPVVVEAKSG